MKNIILENCMLFKGINNNEINEVMNSVKAESRYYKKAEFIFRRGQVIGSMGIVVEGSVHIIREDYWGNRQILSDMVPGDIFGESYACLKSEPLTVDAVAAESSIVIFIDIGSILNMNTEYKGIQSKLVQNLLYILAARNLNLTRKIDHISKRTTREKVMSYLLHQAVIKGGNQFDIPFNRQQFADYLAVDRSALSAELSRMRKEGLIEYKRNSFTINRG